jgi:hypothetical protein
MQQCRKIEDFLFRLQTIKQTKLTTFQDTHFETASSPSLTTLRLLDSSHEKSTKVTVKQINSTKFRQLVNVHFVWLPSCKLRHFAFGYVRSCDIYFCFELRIALFIWLPLLMKFGCHLAADHCRLLAVGAREAIFIVPEEPSEGLFSEAAAVQYCRQILSALAHCHKRGMVHCDQCENILFASKVPASELKIADFGKAFPVDAEYV